MPDLTVLSPKMQVAVNYMRLHGNKLMRFPKGARTHRSWSGGGNDHLHFRPQTIAALARRGMVEYTAWQDGLWEKFPIEVVLREPT